MWRIALCDEDRARFGCGEQLTLDLEAVKDLDGDDLDEIDRAIRLPLAAFLPYLEDPVVKVAQVRRVAVWLALRLAGTSVDWEKCTPKLLRATFVWEAPSGPPDGPSGSSSGDVPPATS